MRCVTGEGERLGGELLGGVGGTSSSAGGGS